MRARAAAAASGGRRVRAARDRSRTPPPNGRPRPAAAALPPSPCTPQPQRAEEEAAAVYEEFVESFKVDDEPGGRGGGGPKAFVRGGVVAPGSSSHAPIGARLGARGTCACLPRRAQRQTAASRGADATRLPQRPRTSGGSNKGGKYVPGGGGAAAAAKPKPEPGRIQARHNAFADDDDDEEAAEVDGWRMLARCARGRRGRGGGAGPAEAALRCASAQHGPARAHAPPGAPH